MLSARAPHPRHAASESRGDVMSDSLKMDLCWMQTLNGFSAVLTPNIPIADALKALQSAQRDAALGGYGAGVIAFLRPAGEDWEVRAKQAETSNDALRHELERLT